MLRVIVRELGESEGRKTGTKWPGSCTSESVATGLPGRRPHASVERHRRTVSTHVRRAVMTPSKLYAALDGQGVWCKSQQWRVEVLSVADRAGSRWVQLLLRGPKRLLLTLSLGRNDNASNILDGISTWLPDPGEKSHYVRTYCVWP